MFATHQKLGVCVCVCEREREYVMSTNQYSETPFNRLLSATMARARRMSLLRTTILAHCYTFIVAIL